MKNGYSSAMRRATELVRAGDPTAATKLIQSALGAKGTDTLELPGLKPSPRPSMPDMGRFGERSGLRETLAKLRKKMPTQGFAGRAIVEPLLADGARFDAGTFSTGSDSRDYRLYVPGKTSGRPAGLLMMLHGCTQSPVDFANGTDMNRVAEANNLIVVYPGQSRGANMQSCWNWFEPDDQDRGAGEPAILAGLAQELQQQHNIPAGRTFVAGLSAGAAMAVILGRTYPEVFAAVGAHSGLPYKSAFDVTTAFAAMGGNGTVASPPAPHPVPTIVFHGTDDSTVHAINGQRIADDAYSQSTEVLEEGEANGRSFARGTVMSAQGGSAVEHWRIEGLGHAWSGGQAAGSFTDTSGPDASVEMVRFFLDLPIKVA